MHHYITHLLADLRDRHDKQPPPVDYRLLHPQYVDVPDEIKYVVEWENAPEQTFEALFDLSPEVFPPAEKLSGSQMQAVLEGVFALWAAWNIYPVLPDNIPVEILYGVVVNYWRNESIHYVSEGNLHLEFCSYDVNDCPWGSAYCTCKDFE